MFLTRKFLSRREVLKGAGAAIALPLLDAMIPARTALAQTAAKASPRLGFVYFPHGALQDQWTPIQTGSNFEFPFIVKPLERDGSIGIRSNALVRTVPEMMERVLAIQKIVAGAVQSFIGAVIVFPIVLLVHAAGQAPHVQVTNWALFAVILVFASLLTSALGLLLGTIMDPRKMQMLFAVILLPATMLGCVYYPWSALHHIQWLQILVLINPMVYMSEGLRAVLTPVLGHMPMWGVLLALIGGTVVFGYLGTRTFTKRVLN